MMLLPLASFAQEKLYTIKGCVVARYSESNFEAEPFMHVRLTDTTGRIHIGGCQTNFDGMYYIDSVHEGRYMLTFSSVGFERYDTVLTIISDCTIDTLNMYNRWYNINGSRIWERQVKIGTPDYTDSYREIYMDYRTAVRDLNKNFKEIYNLLKRCDTLKILNNVDTILTHLKGVSMKPGYFLDICYNESEMTSIIYYYCRKVDDSKQSKKQPLKEGRNILKYMNVEFTPEGIWSAFQLEVSNRYLFKFWHAYYNESWPVFSIKDELISSFYVGRNKIAQELINKLEELPPVKNKVEITSKNTAEITAYFWNNWIGLIEEKIQVKRKGTSVKFIFSNEKYGLTDMTGTVLVPYDCGIMF